MEANIVRISLIYLLSLVAVASASAKDSTLASNLPYLPTGYAVTYDFYRRDISSQKDRQRNFDYQEYIDTLSNSKRNNLFFLDQEPPISGHVTFSIVNQKTFYSESRNYQKYCEAMFDAHDKIGYLYERDRNTVSVVSKSRQPNFVFIPFPIQGDSLNVKLDISTLANVPISGKEGKMEFTKSVDIGGTLTRLICSVRMSGNNGTFYPTYFGIRAEHGDIARWEFAKYGYQEKYWFPRLITEQDGLNLPPKNFRQFVETKKKMTSDSWSPKSEIRYQNIKLVPVSEIHIPTVEEALNSTNGQMVVQDDRDPKNVAAFYFIPGSGSFEHQKEMSVLLRAQSMKKATSIPNPGFFLLFAAPVAVLIWVINRRHNNNQKRR